MKERWSEVRGFPNYAVSSHGKIWNLRQDKEVHPFPDSYGYMRVHLYISGVSKQFLVHRLVGETFMDNYQPRVQMRWLDGNRENNSVENLRFAGDRRTGRLVKDADLIPSRVTRVGIVETKQHFRSVKALADFLETTPKCIYRVLNGERESHAGLTFEYLKFDK